MNKRKIQDLHNHTIFSDGENTAREIIENAIKHKIDMIGITDHYYYEAGDNTERSLMLNKYIEELNELKKEYHSFIAIKAALEICVVPYPEALENIPYDYLEALDYVLIENLELLPPWVSLEEVEKYLKKIKCKIGLAHSDLYQLSSIHKDRGGLNYAADFLKRNNIFYEINSNSSRIVFDTILYEPQNPMVRKIFEVLYENQIKLSIGSDTHSIKHFEYNRLLKANMLVNVEALVEV